MPAQPRGLVGYGSILQRDSRRRNIAYAGDPIPVRVRGYRRSWNVRGPGVGFACTFLGVEADADAWLNAVVTPVEPSEIPGLDQRESEYRRTAVPPSAVECLVEADRDRIAPLELIVYETITPAAADADAPIIQSYVDICLQGCLEVGRRLGDEEGFAREFLTTTAGWSGRWVNDRVFPRAAFRETPDALRIDRLLHEHCPDAFAQIRIE